MSDAVEPLEQSVTRSGVHRWTFPERFAWRRFGKYVDQIDQPGRYLSKGTLMGYGIGGILITILVILAIIYFAKRV